MADLAYPIINGRAYDYASAEVDLGDQGIFTAIKEINCSDSLEPGVLRGTRPEKLARTTGEYDAEGSLVFSTIGAFRAFIAALGDGYMETSFDVVITFSPPPGLSVLRTVMHGCRMKNISEDVTQGTDPIEASCDLDVMWIERDGIKPLAGMLV